MRWRRSSKRNGVLILSVLAFGLLPVATADASGAAACPAPTEAELAPSLIDLHQALGDAMGAPVSCAWLDGRGDVIQIMTRGVAVADPGGIALFASGEQHWALSAYGLESWTGNWHNGLYPPPTTIPEQDQPAPVEGSLATVEPVTVVQVADGSKAVVVQDPAGRTFTVETDSGCPDLVASPGDHLFIRSDGPRTDLILLQQHETCAVGEVNAAAGD